MSVGGRSRSRLSKPREIDSVHSSVADQRGEREPLSIHRLYMCGGRHSLFVNHSRHRKNLVARSGRHIDHRIRIECRSVETCSLQIAASPHTTHANLVRRPETQNRLHKKGRGNDMHVLSK